MSANKRVTYEKKHSLRLGPTTQYRTDRPQLSAPVCHPTSPVISPDLACSCKVHRNGNGLQL